jgi:hypothetical protein
MVTDAAETCAEATVDPDPDPAMDNVGISVPASVKIGTTLCLMATNRPARHWA